MNRKYRLVLLALVVAGIPLMAQTQQQRLEKHLYYLASDTLQGRKAGTADSRKAAAYIVDEYRQMGLQPLGGTYRHHFLHPGTALRGGTTLISADMVEYYADHDKTVYCNLVGIIEGSDPLLKDEYIVVGGHYDHLGVMDGKIYNGADDNASGTASVIEVARQLLARRSELGRSVIICAFDAEELGLYGSQALSEELQKTGMMERVKMMMSIDMVGWLKQGRHLRLTGTGTLKGCADMINEVASQTGLPVSTTRFESSPFTATDTEPFAAKGVPTLAVTTGLKSPYHKPADDPELIDYPGLSQVTDFLSALTLRMASAGQPMEATGRLAAKHRGARPLAEVGLALGYNAARIHFPNAMLQCDAGVGFTGGVSTQWAFSHLFGLKIDALYELSNAPYPDEQHLFGKGLNYRQHALLVPLQFQLLLGDPSLSVNLGLGGFYSYRFAGTLDDGGVQLQTFPAQHQYGIVWSIDERFANFSIAFTSYYQLQDLFAPAPASIIPAAQKYAFALTLGYYL